MPRLTMRTCTSTRTGLHPVSHASVVTKGARRANQEGPRRVSSVGSRTVARSCAFTFARLFRPTRIPCPAGPLEQCRSWGRRLSGFWGLPLEGERRGIQRVARCDASSSNLLCIQKRKKRAALRAHRAWQRLQGQPLQRARTALAEFVLVCRTLKTRYRSRRAATGSGKHPHQSDSGCARGPSRGNRVCKRNAVSQRRNGAVGRHVGGKTNESRTGSRHWVDSRCCAADVARRRPKKCTFRWKSCRIAKRRGLHGPRCEAN